MQAEAYSEFSVFLVVQELLLDHDPKLRSAHGTSDYAHKQYKTTGQYKWAPQSRKNLAREAVGEQSASFGDTATELRVGNGDTFVWVKSEPNRE